MGWLDDIRVSVNLSPLQSSVVSALAFSGLPPSRLELEITKSVLLKKKERNISPS
jgi:EAL domain-containing protein (putative c-di-GMP-specific phosphodiesterase class I)